MAYYRNILAAVDLNDESNVVIYKATELGNLYSAPVSIVHVIEPLGYAYGGDIPVDLTEVQQQLQEHAKQQLIAIGKQFDISENCIHIIIGRPDTEIHRLAEEKNFDLVVVGSHGRHGLQLLMGSTSSGVLHGASCDILAVRLHKE
ncbi:MAG: universal stress protein UspA [Gammaproteobacteria bacterium]|nr:MAG: universal stress protein UspA [Gammaproteobacteria bacterium]